MEKFEPNYSSLSSYAEAISSDLEICQDSDDFYVQYAKEVVEDCEFEDNFGQVLKMAKLVSEPGIDDEKVTNNFVMGEILAYAVLQRMFGPDIHSDVYDAMNMIYSEARRRVNFDVLDEESNYTNETRNRMTGVYINHLMDIDMCFDSLPNDEMLVVTKLFEDILADESEVYDAMRGYSLVRASLIWRDRNITERIRESFDIDKESQLELREFYDLMADVEVDAHLADGQISVQDEIDDVYQTFTEAVNELDVEITDINDGSYEKVKEKIINKITPEIFYTPELSLLDKIYIDGINVAMLCDEDGDILQMIPLGKSVQIKGLLLDYDVNPTPTRDWLLKMHDALENRTSKKTGVPFNPFGLVVLLGEPKLVNTLTETTYSIRDDVYVFVPLGYDSSTIYKIMLPEEEDEDRVEYDESDDEDDE